MIICTKKQRIVYTIRCFLHKHVENFHSTKKICDADKDYQRFSQYINGKFACQNLLQSLYTHTPLNQDKFLHHILCLLYLQCGELFIIMRFSFWILFPKKTHVEKKARRIYNHRKFCMSSHTAIKEFL